MHTVEPGCLRDTYEVRGIDGYICLTTNKPAAQRIAHALNHHDALVAALEHISNWAAEPCSAGYARRALAAAKGKHHAD